MRCRCFRADLVEASGAQLRHGSIGPQITSRACHRFKSQLVQLSPAVPAAVEGPVLPSGQPSFDVQK